ncbi:hypothetical protein EG329_006653 [Mollisiaceae sp. DMI_Dod_QoI]|nr:hypothetical protein EG329_006653 [Helotiales sp. DMI_Dod_QoI]
MYLTRSYLAPVQLVRKCLHLPISANQDEVYPITPEAFEDVIFIAIDFENGDKLTRSSKEQIIAGFGVCILDTRDLASSSSTNPLQTFNFVTGGNTPKSPRHYLFGRTQHITVEDICSNLERLIDRGRNLVFVGHHISQDLSPLNALGFDLDTGISAMLDTQRMAKKVLGSRVDALEYTLKGLLEKVGCPFRDLHVGGNDAHFTMRALLLLVAESYQGCNETLPDDTKKRIEKLRLIGRAPISSYRNAYSLCF